MSITLPEFTPAQESLFLTLGSRALDSRLPHPFLDDAMADDILTTIGYDLSKFPQLTTRLLDRRSRVFDAAVRAKKLDDVVRRFVRCHPDAVVLDLGAGLDGRMARVDPPPSVDWYDVDYPNVITLRRKVLQQNDNEHNIGTDLTAPGWLSGIPGSRPSMIVADGLLLFLDDRAVVTLLNRLVTHFCSGELALNAYSPWAIWTFKHSSAMRAIAAGVANTGLKDPRDLERAAPGLRLVEEIFLTRTPEVSELPALGRLTSRLAAMSATTARMMRTMVLRYRF